MQLLSKTQLTRGECKRNERTWTWITWGHLLTKPVWSLASLAFKWFALSNDLLTGSPMTLQPNMWELHVSELHIEYIENGSASAQQTCRNRNDNDRHWQKTTWNIRKGLGNQNAKEDQCKESKASLLPNFQRPSRALEERMPTSHQGWIIHNLRGTAVQQLQQHPNRHHAYALG